MSRDVVAATGASSYFDNRTNSFVSENVQAAIEEVDSKVTGKPRAVVLFGYGANASNRWLEMHHSVPSNTSPYVAAELSQIKAISMSFKVSSTVTASVYVNGIVVDTLVVTANTKGSKKDLSHAVAIDDDISIKITSGSASEPTVTISLEIQL